MEKDYLATLEMSFVVFLQRLLLLFHVFLATERSVVAVCKVPAAIFVFKPDINAEKLLIIKMKYTSLAKV